MNLRKKETIYQKLSLVELIDRIVKGKDYLALNEFHQNRSVFESREGDFLRFAEYLNQLRENALKRNWIGVKNIEEIIDNAYNLTLDKFNNLPTQCTQISRLLDKSLETKTIRGPDCRNYFKAFLDNMVRIRQYKTIINQIEEEIVAARVLQNLVTKHFYISLRESLRTSNPFVSRYFWKVKKRIFYLWFPSHMTGKEKRRWLEANIKNVDVLNPRECERIQAIINKKLLRGTFVSIEDYKQVIAAMPKSDMFILESVQKSEINLEALKEIVAEEKVKNITTQRPAIRILGKEKLKKIILYIFEALSEGEYKDVKIAQQFGLSKATFSRFAGSRWQKRSRERKKLMVPDLWKNTAQILAKDPIFREVAKDAGVWQEIEKTLQIGIATFRRRNNNE